MFSNTYDNYNSRDKNGLLKRVEHQLLFLDEENKTAIYL